MSVTSIEDMGLENVENLTINYAGSEEDWNSITISDESLEDVEIVYDSEAEPDAEEEEDSNDDTEDTTPDSGGNSGGSSDENDSDENDSTDSDTEADSGDKDTEDDSADSNTEDDATAKDTEDDSADSKTEDDATDTDGESSDTADEESEDATVESQLSVRDLPLVATMTTSTFSDMTDSTKWYYEAVKFVYDRGLMAGTGVGVFAPDTPTSRGMIVTILHNLAGKPSETGSYYADVQPDDYFSNAVSWASAVGIATGKGGNSFEPDGDMLREELAVMLYAYEKLMNGSYVGQKNLPFTDTSAISSWAEEAISWCYAQGIVSGKDGGDFDPQGSATRGEVATMLRRFVNYATETSTSSVEFTSYKIPGLSF